MTPAQVSLLITLVVLLAAALVAEGAWLWWRDTIAPRRREAQRLRRLAGPGEADAQRGLTREIRQVDGRFGPIVADLDRRLLQAGMTMAGTTLLAGMAGGVVGLVLLLPLLFGYVDRLGSPAVLLLTLLVAVAAAVVLPLMFIDQRGARRLRQLEEQFPLALDIFIRGLRAGHPVSRSLELLIREMADPIASEFEQVVAQVNYGWDLRQALEALGERVQTQDVRMFVVSMAIQAETGGSLAEVLDGLTKVIRDRASMKLKVRALASEGKMTAGVLSGVPVLTFLAVFALNPAFYLDVADDPAFLPSVIALLSLYLTGVYSIRRMINLKI
jgi:tight adherence protein B